MLRTAEFYTYVMERENIRLRRAAGNPAPWTTDKILQNYKFTNVFREYDRTTRELLHLYTAFGSDASAEMQLMNCAIARYFGTFEFFQSLGFQREWLPEFIIDKATIRKKSNLRVFTGAYIVTNMGQAAPKHETVVREFLQSLMDNAPAIVKVAHSKRRWKDVIERMSEVTGFGGTGFMSKEIILDTMLLNPTTNSPWATSFWKDGLPLDFEDWTPIGPGARRGAARVVGENPGLAKFNEVTARDILQNLHRMQRDRLPSEFRRLTMHDVQFCACEFDKYERVRLGEGRPRSRYPGTG